MLPRASLPIPASLMTLLAVLSPSFTAPSFRTFCGLACGFPAQPGKRTVCGMLAGAGLSRLWPHDRAHYFFARARWKPDDLGLAVARPVVSRLVPDGQAVEAVVDDTLFRRRGKKVWAASWFHDGSAPGPAKTGYGNNWVVLAVIVRLPVLSRPVAVPVMAKLVIKGSNSRSRLWLARRMAEALARALPGRAVHVTADSAYAGAELKGLPPAVTWTTRLRKDAALHGLPRPGSPEEGPARVRGDRLPPLAKMAATAAFTQVTVTRYGKEATIRAAVITCLWYSVLGPRPVTVVLSGTSQPPASTSPLTTDPRAAVRHQRSPPDGPLRSTADQRICAIRHGPGAAARLPRGRETHRRGTDGEGGSGHADRPGPGRHLAVPGVRLAGERLELADSSTVTGPVITNGDRSSSLVQVRTSGRPPARGYMLSVVVPVAAGSAGRAASSPGMREHVDGRLSRLTSRTPGQWEGPPCPNHRVHFPISPAFVS